MSGKQVGLNLFLNGGTNVVYYKAATMWATRPVPATHFYFVILASFFTPLDPAWSPT